MSSLSSLEPVVHPSAWRGRQMRGSEDWMVYLSKSDNKELLDALSFAKARGADIPSLDKDDFPLPTVAGKLLAMREDVVNGRGFALLRGLDIESLPVKETAMIYWGIGAHLGKGAAQNAQGDMLGHITDLGLDFSDLRVRGYQTRLRLDFHNDSRDMVGLLCLRSARSGGASRIISSMAIHNAMLMRRPDLLLALYDPVSIDRRGEAPAGRKPFYTGAVFESAGDRLFCRYQRRNFETAQRFDGARQLAKLQTEAFDMVDALCGDPEFYLDMDFRPGDMQFLCNYTVLHSRTEYEDWPEPERRRYLLRLWLDTGLIKDFPASWRERFEDQAIWQRDPKPPVYDLSRRRAELEH